MNTKQTARTQKFLDHAAAQERELAVELRRQGIVSKFSLVREINDAFKADDFTRIEALMAEMGWQG